jgi:plastocyanin
MSSLISLRRLCLVSLGIACLGLGACGSSKSSSSGSSSTTTKSSSASSSGGTASAGGGSKVALKADASALKFDKKTATAKAGAVTMTMVNPSGGQTPHAIAVEGNGVDKDGKVAQPGGTSTVSVKLKPGKYTFYCPVDGHRKAGMQGTLTVN